MTKFEIYSILENVDLVKGLNKKQLEDLLRRMESSSKESLYGAINIFIAKAYERKQRE